MCAELAEDSGLNCLICAEFARQRRERVKLLARCLPWLQPLQVPNCLEPFKLFPRRVVAVRGYRGTSLIRNLREHKGARAPFWCLPRGASSSLPSASPGGVAFRCESRKQCLMQNDPGIKPYTSFERAIDPRRACPGRKKNLQKQWPVWGEEWPASGPRLANRARVSS